MRVYAGFSILWGFVAFSSLASATPIHCPQTIQTNQSLRGNLNQWEAFQDDLNSIHYFERVTFYSGHPKEHASLAPDHEDSKKEKLTWSLGKQEIWIACEYTGTKIQLIQKLPYGSKSCNVTYKKNYSKVVSINCI
ncbi:hypothetical protein OQJ18_08260 [Fluoribacter dumoffii]|uniref:Uncharacterized protein n=1 Tax=Fluoribacter dumoffii TaxID=463 RepID=A0A377G8S7_9GAMM|nr:STY0301 family protein [Fluoribacter dumoffii]KTC89656.1 hypothetical protein Ldum_0724 [Fluoribacter dumoffii NY 23]MCW8384849.1 hypothetical protein [Fluoribacter dumoffii]MCW8417912.1 hypothetical protein [Fluoribacter dumoffii]MCW8454246.1 hypothetical protein [Fluoribacter dumoffii]MCW8461680.1 hypothetical protein [Fluoribacter dumoffii]